MYGYNSQIHRSTSHTQLALCLSRHPPNPVFLALTCDTASYIPFSMPTSTRTTYLRNQDQLQVILTDTDANLHFDQAIYKIFFDKKVRVKTRFQLGDELFVNLSPVEIQRMSETDTSPTTANSSLGTNKTLLPKFV